MADATNNQKAVTLENLAVFKQQMDASVDRKIANIGSAIELPCATEEDILALFAEPAPE